MCEADNLTTFMCRMSWKSGSLNLLEPSGPHQACYGTRLPLPFTLSPNNDEYTCAVTEIHRVQAMTDTNSLLLRPD
jgi:hypothetical protein